MSPRRPRRGRSWTRCRRVEQTTNVGRTGRNLAFRCELFTSVRHLSPVRVVGIIAVMLAAIPAMFSPRAEAATSVRYLNQVFTSSTKVANLTYGQAMNSKTGKVETLLF